MAGNLIMCGIAGLLFVAPRAHDAITNCLFSMGKKLLHRGPDATGHWIDPGNKLGLLHTRLAIQDLSINASQPMRSDDGRYVIAFNGEIYNHLHIRCQLKKKQWNSHSDTETILALIEAQGVEKALFQLQGMFAIALWDIFEQNLYLIRDRAGEKPLFFSKMKDIVVFGSEIKALQASDILEKDINKQGLDYYLKFGYFPPGQTIYETIYEIKPGQIVVVSTRGDEHFNFKEIQYWDLDTQITDKRKKHGDYKAAVDGLNTRLHRVIKDQLLSDVPLGVFLSGGIDSSLIASVASAVSGERIKTFSVGFDDPRYDESGYARDVATHIGSEHYELIITAKDMLLLLEQLPSMLDQPFGDSSFIPTFLLSRFAKQYVTVALTGDAGDELFGGYGHYMIPPYWSALKRVPYYFRKKISNMIGNRLFVNHAIYEKYTKGMPIVEYMRSASEMLRSKNILELTECRKSAWRGKSEIFIDQMDNIALSDCLYREDLSEIENLMQLDFKNFLTRDILVKVDRAAMLNSLETRAPFLDHSIIEYAWSLPEHYKIAQKNTKIILRSLLENYMPRTLFERPKRGFAIPLGKWMRNELRDWCGDILGSYNFRNQDYINKDIVYDAWKNHLNGTRDYSAFLWYIFVFLSWHEANRL
jgi:asparagine synthase (glutamine-hydrolysing)